MKCKLLCKLKGLLGIYTPGCEYWVDLKDIDIPINFLRHHPRHEKMEQKWAYYRQTGEFESPILLNRNFELVDGYTSYIIAKTENLHKVPVYFMDQNRNFIWDYKHLILLARSQMFLNGKALTHQLKLIGESHMENI